MASEHGSRQVPTFCALCVARCGAKATITDGVFVAPQPDPSHPAGQALCVKGKAGPELVNHPERLLYPLRRTEPKGAADPGWQRITWEEALDTVSARLLAPSAAGSRPTSSAAGPTRRYLCAATPAAQAQA